MPAVRTSKLRGTRGRSPRGGRGAGSSASGNAGSTTDPLVQTFYSFAGENALIMDVDACMRFFSALNVSLEDPVVLCVHAGLKADSIGHVPLEKWQSGWSALKCHSIDDIKRQIQNWVKPVQTQHSYRLSEGLQMDISQGDELHSENGDASVPFAELSGSSTEGSIYPAWLLDSELMQQVYAAAFTLIKPPNTRQLPPQVAVEYWKILLAAQEWPYLWRWLQFIETPERIKGVSRDLWLQLWHFQRQYSSMNEFLSHDPNEAWPTLIDQVNPSLSDTHLQNIWSCNSLF